MTGGPKIGSFQLILPSGRTFDSKQLRFDPEVPGDWLKAATIAEAFRRFTSDQLVPIILRAEAGSLST